MGERSRIPHGEILDVGTEAHEQRKVVRVFVAQSLSAQDVLAQFDQLKKEAEESGRSIDWSRLFFTGVLWSEKSSDSMINPGQIMPVGGKIGIKTYRGEETVETALEAAERELLQETHLRPVANPTRLDVSYEYTLESQGKKTDINQQFFWTEVLPTDRPYPLEPLEDKIGNFHLLTPEEMGELFSRMDPVEMHTSGGIPQQALLGNMRIFDEGRAADKNIALKPENAHKPFELFVSLCERVHNRERDKRCQIIEGLFRYYKVLPIEQAQWWDELRRASDFFSFQNVYRRLMETYGSHSDIKDALDFAVDTSNFQEEVWTPRPMGSRMESIMRLIYTLLETRHYADAYMALASRDKNAHLKDFVERIIAFANSVSPTDEPLTLENIEQSPSEERILKKLSRIRRLSDKSIEEKFTDAFDLSLDRLPERMDRVNKYIADVVSRGVVARVGVSYQKELVGQITEISNGSLVDLIRYAFPVDGSEWKDRVGQGSHALLLKKRIAFEARRKLALLYLFTGTDEYLEQKIQLGIRPIEEGWKNATSFPSESEKLDYVFSETSGKERHLVDVVVGTGLHNNAYQGSSFKHIPQETVFRRFTYGSGKGRPSFLINNDVRRKSTASAYRKSLTEALDDPTKILDVYGRLLPIVQNAEDARSLEYVNSIETRRIAMAHSVDAPLEEIEVTDYAPVLDIIEYWSEQSGVRVLKYKSTPKGNEGIDAATASGGQIRVAKFYIEHTDKKRQKRYEEVQIYTPSPDGKSSFYWLEKKKEDDDRYFIDRLHDTKGLHSFLEIMFPTGIYGGPMHALQTDRRRRAKVKKSI